MKDADAVCDEVRRGLAALQPGPTEMEEISSAARAQADVVERALDELRPLAPPDELAAEIDSWLAAVDRWRVTLTELAEAGRRDDQASAGRLEDRLLVLQRTRAELAAEIGFSSCRHL